MALRNLNIPIALNTSKNDLIGDFFNPLLSNSIKYDRGVGYFTSGWLQENFYGMNHFAENGGRARWITSPILSKKDWGALFLGDEAKNDKAIQNKLIEEIETLSIALKKKTLLALSWMISDGIIDFRIAKPRNKLTEEFHSKTGIFTDKFGDKISFDGSYNDSRRGLYAVESLKVFRSWDETNEYVEHEVNWFNKVWENKDPNIHVFNLPEVAKLKLMQYTELGNRPYKNNIKYKLPNIDNGDEIVLPKPQIPEWVKLRDYQNSAISSWEKNNRRGILEMATGTGKTITAISSLIPIVEKEKGQLILVIVPYLHLVDQWKNELSKFGFQPFSAAESKNKWVGPISQLIRDVSNERKSTGVIVTTTNTFSKGHLSELIQEYGSWEKTLFVADEVHHCGTFEMLRKLPQKTLFRLGLSATPVRQYDEFGTDQLMSFFNGVVFRFGLKEAIREGYLTKYYYHPIPVHMTIDEFAKFSEISKKLAKFHSDKESPISEAALQLAIKRARVLNNSTNKIEWVRKNIELSDELIHTLFYVGEQIFDAIRELLGYIKKIPIHEFTHRQNLKQRNEILNRFEEGEIKALVAMKCLDEGVDVPPTKTAYFLASSSVSREFIQRRGRILRTFPGKKYANVYDLISVPPIHEVSSGKTGKNYKIVRSAIKREYKRIKQFAELAENKYQALGELSEIANMYDLLDQ
jgi:superfamily II DNA or RNA helicase